MQKLLETVYYRRLFIAVVVLVLISLGLLRYAVLPFFDPSLAIRGAQLAASIVEKLLTSFFVTVVIGLFIFWLEPKVMRRANLVTIEPKEISGLLDSAVSSTEKWWFRGGTGRHLRAVTLPKLAEVTRKTSSNREIHVQLIDPTENRICEKYASYRRGLNSASKEQSQWTEERVRKEIYATLLTVFIKAHEYPLLNIRITLLQSFSSFRLDLSSQYVILTKEDPRVPGVRCDQGSYFYEAYKDDLDLSARQGKSLEARALTSKATVQSVRAHFFGLDILTDDISDDLLQSIIDIANSAKSPYA